jgi:secreted trypsin-like serine protease
MGISFRTVEPDLDELAVRRGLKNVKFTVVGYWLQMVRPHILAERTRYVAEVMLVDHRSALNDGYNTQLTSNPGQGTGPGGVCFGDSGGPVIHSGEQGEVIVALNSFVLNQNCMGTAFAFRVDTAEAWELLEQYVTSD